MNHAAAFDQKRADAAAPPGGERVAPDRSGAQGFGDRQNLDRGRLDRLMAAPATAGSTRGQIGLKRDGGGPSLIGQRVALSDNRQPIGSRFG